jgi:radical SAM superfamily enzyme YgiQ (UPF0313 family)
VGLEGASLSDYPGLEPLGNQLIEAGHEISFSSLRADRITPQLLEVLEKGNVRSFTMAPEAGSERLRRRIGKPISDAVLTGGVRMLASSSVEILKLYFLIGLPGEDDSDIDAITDCVRETARVFNASGGRRIRVSINAFVPKPFTEFQWAAMDREASLIGKRERIARGLRGLRGVALVRKSVREELLQGMLAVGDERAGMAVHDRVVHGMPWKKAFRNNGVNPEVQLHEPRFFEHPLPWDFIETGTP